MTSIPPDKPPDDRPPDEPGEPAHLDLDDSEDQPPRTIHDALFKSAFGDPGHAAVALQAILPPRVVRHIDWTSLEARHASIVDSGFKQQHGDLLFSARLESGGGEIFLWLLFEHQSSVDYWMSRRVLELSVEILQRWHAQNPEARRLPAILPVVLYHGREPWNAPTSFIELLDLTDEQRRDLGEYLLSYRFVLEDLRTTETADILARPLDPLGRLSLMAMKHGPDREMSEQLLALHEDIRALMATEQGRLKCFMVLRYTWHVNPYLDWDALVRELVPVVSPEFEDTMLTYAQKLEKKGFDKGIEKGREQGLEKGLEQGQRALLRRQFERRFGTLPGHVEQRIEQASSDEIDRWSTRILDARSLDDIFTP
jgi:predicted transposase YdaD